MRRRWSVSWLGCRPCRAGSPLMRPSAVAPRGARRLARTAEQARGHEAPANDVRPAPTAAFNVASGLAASGLPFLADASEPAMTSCWEFHAPPRRSGAAGLGSGPCFPSCDNDAVNAPDRRRSALANGCSTSAGVASSVRDGREQEDHPSGHSSFGRRTVAPAASHAHGCVGATDHRHPQTGLPVSLRTIQGAFAPFALSRAGPSGVPAPTTQPRRRSKD